MMSARNVSRVAFPSDVFFTVTKTLGVPVSAAKVTYWLFGNHQTIIDTTIEGIRYINNPYLNKSPYWAKRISIST